MKLLWQGMIIGLSIVLPGISGGTVFIILGIYEKTIRDISSLRLKPYKTFLVGGLFGMFLSGQILSELLVHYPTLSAAFFMGIVLASVKAVFRNKPTVSGNRILILIVGLVAGFLMTKESFQTLSVTEIAWWFLFLSGAISSIAMLVPGVSGSAFLIMLGIYSDIIHYLQTFRFLELTVFGLGAALGVFIFSKLLEKIYFKYQVPCTFLFAGLIIGSTRALIPGTVGFLEVLVFIAGFSLVWFFESQQRASQAKEAELAEKAE